MSTFSGSSLIVTACSAALFAGALAGCSSSGGSASNKLTKAEFITQADAACASTLAKIKATPTPTSLTDYAAILNYDTIGLTEEPKFHQTIAGLADRSPDAAALHKNWIDIDTADFAAQKPLIAKLDDAAKAKDASKVTALVNQLSALPDHTSAEATYLTSYGLTQCAALANYGNSN